MKKDTSKQRSWGRWAAIAIGVLVAVALWSVLAPRQPLSWLDIDAILGPGDQPTAAPPVTLPEKTTAPGVVTFPSFDVVRVTRGGTGVIAGRAAPFAEVEILANGKTLGRVTADQRGEWVLIFDTPLKSGGSELSLMSRLPGMDAVQSQQIVVVAVPEKSETFVDSSEEGVVAILTPRDGQGRSVVLQRPASGGDFGGGLMLDTIDYNEAGAATFSGRAAARSEVRLYIDNTYIGTALANESGRWAYAPADPVSAGDHVARLDQVFGDGKVQLRVEIPFNRDKPLDVARAEGSIEVQPGNNLWQISRRLYGSGFHYTLIFGLNKDQIKDPDLIYPGQVFQLPKSKPN